MASFRDMHGTEWALAPITVGMFGDLKRLGLDLTTKRKPDEIDRAAMAAIASPETLVNLGYWLCRKDLEAAGVSDVQFAERIDGESLLRLQDAIIDVYVDFFRPGPRGQAVRERIKNLLAKLMDAADDIVVKKIEQAGALATPEKLETILSQSKSFALPSQESPA